MSKTGALYDPRDADEIQNPLPSLRLLQDRDPVHWSPELRGWVITRYDDVKKILASSDVSADRLTPFYNSRQPAQQQRIYELVRYLNTWVAFKDPPDHSRLRSLLNRAVSPSTMRSLGHSVQAMIDELLRPIVARGGEAFEFIEHFANPLPASVIMDLLGVPISDMPEVRHWSAQIQPFIGGATVADDKYDVGREGIVAMADYFLSAVRSRESHRRSDVISHLMGLRDAGEITEDELIGTCILLLFAGHETTTNLIGNGLRALIEHPLQMGKLRDDPTLIDSAVEEMLRFDGPTGAVVRIVHRAISFHGKELKPGERIFAMVNAANHDPRKFADGDEFDIERTPNRHLTFNHGAHFCLGAPLARLEAQLAFTSILAAFRDIRLTGPTPQYMDTIVMRGVREMWLAVEPASDTLRPH